MNAIKCKTTIVTVSMMSFGFLSCAMAQESESLSQLLERYDKSSVQVTERYQARLAKLDANYLEALEKMQTSFNSRGDRASTAAVEKTVEAYRRNRNSKFSPVEGYPKALEQMKKKLVFSRKRLLSKGKTESYQLMKQIHGKLKVLKAEYKEQRKIYAIQEVEVKLEQVEADALYVEYKKIEEGRGIRGSLENSLEVPKAPASVQLNLRVFKKNISKKVKEGDDLDNKRQDLTFTVKLKSRELSYTHRALTIRVRAFGRASWDKHEFKMVVDKSLALSELPPGKEITYQTDVVENFYDDDYDDQFGHKQYGYVVDVLNADGKILCSKSGPSNMDKNLEKIRAQDKKEIFHL